MIQISVLFSDTHRLSYNCCWWKSIPISSGMNKKNSTGQHDFIMPSPGSAPKMPSSLSNHCQMRRMGLEYLWQHLAWTYGKCRKIRHTWMVCVYIYIHIQYNTLFPFLFKPLYNTSRFGKYSSQHGSYGRIHFLSFPSPLRGLQRILHIRYLQATGGYRVPPTFTPWKNQKIPWKGTHRIHAWYICLHLP